MLELMHPLHAHSGGYSGGPRAAMGDYTKYPEGRPIFLPESERYGNPPDLPSLLLQQRVIYISMPVRSYECYDFTRALYAFDAP